MRPIPVRRLPGPVRTCRLSALVFLAIAGCHRTPPAAGPVVEVHVDVPGTTAGDVETSTTMPIERACAAAPHVVHVRSLSEPGRSSVTVQLDRGSDVDAALAALQDALRGASRSLPAHATPPVLRRASGVLVARYTTRSDVLPLTQVHDAQQPPWIERLERTAGVARVVTCGDLAPRVSVNVEARVLAATGLTMPDVVTGLSRSAPPADASALSAMVLAQVNGAPLRLREGDRVG